MCSHPMPRPRIYHDDPDTPLSRRRREPPRNRSLSPRRVHFAPPPCLDGAPQLQTTSVSRPRSQRPCSILRPSSFPTTTTPFPLLPPCRSPPPPPSLLFPASHPTSLPTVYILTYASSQTPSLSSFFTLLDSQLPTRNPPIKHLYTINASIFPAPPRDMCERYSGIAPEVQDYVMGHAPARVAVRRAVEEILGFGAVEREKQRREGQREEWKGRWKRGLGDDRTREKGEMEVALSVCCPAGTHRSVAVGEKIAQGVRGEVGRRGGRVCVFVRHVARVRGWGDPF